MSERFLFIMGVIFLLPFLGFIGNSLLIYTLIRHRSQKFKAEQLTFKPI